MAGAITASLTEISYAEATTNWAGDTFSLEPDIKVQGSNSVACAQTATGNNDAYYDDGSTTWDITGSHIRVGLNISYIGNLTVTDPMQVFVSDGTNTDYVTIIASSSDYSGGWIDAIVDAALFTTVTKTAISRVGYRGVTATKPRNVPANTWLDNWRHGNGLEVRSATTEAVSFQDVADLDVASSYFILSDVDGVLFCAGELILGDEAGASDLNLVSSNETIVFPDRKVTSTLYKLKGVEDTGQTDIDITGLVCKTVGGTGAEIDFSDVTITSLSLASSTFIDMGTSNIATGTISGTKFTGCGTTTLGSGTTTCTVTSTSWIGSAQIILTDGSLTSCNIETSTASSALLATDLDLINTCHFIGDSTGHAIELNVSASDNYTWDSTFDTTTYATSDGSTGNELIYVNDSNVGNTYTIAVSAGATTPTIRTAGATVTVNSDKTVTFTGMKDNTEVRIYKSSDGSVVDGIEDATAGSTDDRNFAWSAPAALEVDYILHNFHDTAPDYETIRVNGYTVPSSNTSVAIQQRIDRNSF